MIGTFYKEIYPETEEGQRREEHAYIILSYFEMEKKAREYGIKIGCDWDTGVFQLVHGKEILEETDDLFDLRDLLTIHIQNVKEKLGL